MEEAGLVEQNGAWDLELLAAVQAQRGELDRTIELLGTTPGVALSLHDLEPFSPTLPSLPRLGAAPLPRRYHQDMRPGR